MSQAATLSICIATMNRAKFIGATLDSIISQVTEEVEIVIVDGASTDGTGDVVARYQERCSTLRYYRLGEKGGVDQDYCRAVDLATGQYCWLFTDDDIMKPGAINAVLSAIRDDYGLVIVNAEVRNEDLSALLEERSIRTATNKHYASGETDALFVDAVNLLSFIGCVVIRRSIWDARDKTSYYGTVFVHVGVIFQAPLPERALVLAEPWVAIRYGNALWTPKSFEISTVKWPTLLWSFSSVSEAAKQKVTGRDPWDSVTALLIYRARAALSATEYHQLLRPRIRSSTRRMVIRTIVALPGCPLNTLLLIYMAVFGWRHSQRGIRLVDLRKSRFYYKQVLAELVGRTTRARRRTRWFAPENNR